MHDPKAAHPSLSEQLRRTLPRRPHVLLVLKDQVYATAIALWLARLGWKVTHVTEVTEALEAWRESGAGVALVDIDDDGLGALAVLAAATAFRPLGRAVICTRDRALVALPDDLRQRLGIEDVAVRPCHVSVLGAAILRAAGHPESRAGELAALADRSWDDLDADPDSETGEDADVYVQIEYIGDSRRPVDDAGEASLREGGRSDRERPQ
jgi:DNA-binding NtrC family response regulator